MGTGHKRRKAKIRVSQRVTLVNKNDNTRVARPNASIRKYKKINAQLPRNNAAVFKVRIKKK